MYNDELKLAKEQAIAAKKAATQSTVDTLNANNATIQQQAEQARRAAEANARLTSQGTNERAASMGLAGNAYKAPTSGYSETSRVSQDNAYRGALNTVTGQENTALRDVQTQVNQAQAMGNSELAATESDWGRYMYEQEQAAAAAKSNQEYQYAQLMGTYNGQQTLQARQMALDEDYRQKSIALQEADATGIYNGTETFAARQAKLDEEYRQETLAIQKSDVTGMYNGQSTYAAQQAAKAQAVAAEQYAADERYRQEQLKLQQEAQAASLASSNSTESSYSPRLSATEAAKAIASGDYSDQAVWDYYYYYGKLPAGYGAGTAYNSTDDMLSQYKAGVVGPDGVTLK